MPVSTRRRLHSHSRRNTCAQHEPRACSIGAGAAAIAAIACSPAARPAPTKRKTSPTRARRRRRTRPSGDTVTIGFSGPAADHGWLGAINSGAIAAAESFPDVELQRRRGHERRQRADRRRRDLHQRRRRRDRAAADRRRRADRGRDQGDGGRHPGHQRRPRVLQPVRRPRHGARRQLRHGRQRRHVHLRAARRQPRRRRRRDRRHRLAAADAGPLGRASPTRSRTADSRSATASPPTSPSRAARPRHRSCCRPTRRSTRIWNHDDDQGIGVLAAIEAAGRDEFFMVGGAGSQNAMEAIEADDTRARRRRSSTRRRRPPTASRSRA